MKFGIIIPAHNEEQFIAQTLDSLFHQSHPVTQIIVVDDGSTDKTAEIVEAFCANHPELSLVKKPAADSGHLPGSKVIAAFEFGQKHLSEDLDVICKYDADLVFPENYLERLRTAFEADPKVGMAGGFCHIVKEGKWVLESLTGPDHIRGALKAYRKSCFEQIGGLKQAMGWDTVDEFLVKYYDWKVVTIAELAVKHLKPTGHNYNKKARFKQGKAFYRMRFRPLLTTIASLKMAVRKRSLPFFFNTIWGFVLAWKNGESFLVDKKQGRFIRSLRYRKIMEKLFGR